MNPRVARGWRIARRPWVADASPVGFGGVSVDAAAGCGMQGFGGVAVGNGWLVTVEVSLLLVSVVSCCVYAVCDEYHKHCA
jgi:hypothetical protein